MKEEHSKLVKKHFEIRYKDYDKLIRKLIPKYNEIHNLVINSLNFNKNKKIKILDLGVGTGQTALEILRRFPNAMIKGVDISGNMLKQGKERLNQYSRKIKFIKQNIIRLDLKEKFDGTISVLCIHHLNSKQKQELFFKVFNLLEKQGVFIIADIIKFDSEKETKEKEEEWKRFLIKNLGNKEADFWFNNYQEEDLPDSVNNQIRWLKELGFNEVKCIFEYMNYAVLVARKI